MALSSVDDLIHDTAEIKQYNQNGFPTYIQIDRAFGVQGLASTPSTIISETAINWVKVNKAPVGALHPTEPFAKARYYKMVPLESDDACLVVVSFVYTDIPIDSTQWTIESRTYLETIETDSELGYTRSGSAPRDGSLGTITATATGYGDLAHIKPILVDNYHRLWLPNKAKAAGADLQSPTPAIAVVQRPRKQLIMTKTIYGTTNATTLESAADTYIGGVNATTFRGKPPWTWLCLDVDVIYQPYQGSNMGRLEFIYKPEGWQPWVRYQNPLVPTPNVFRKDSLGDANGYQQKFEYFPVELNDLVSLI